MNWEVRYDRLRGLPCLQDARSCAAGPGSTQFRTVAVAPTSNTATYCRLGDSELPFFLAFEEPGVDPARVPTWSVSEVVSSDNGVTVGSRWLIYGPLSTHHCTQVRREGYTLFDTCAQREFLHPWYRTFGPVTDEVDAAVASAVWPVFPASWAVASDALERGADTVVLTSASSRTALGVAHILAPTDIKVVGITRNESAPWLESLELHDIVLPPEEYCPVAAADRTVIIDFTGSPGMFAQLDAAHPHGVAATYSVGYTHPDAAIEPPILENLRPAVFFTPSEEERLRDLAGRAAYDTGYTHARDSFSMWYSATVRYRDLHDGVEVRDELARALSGDFSPSTLTAFRADGSGPTEPRHQG